MTDKSYISNETIEESTIKSFTTQPVDSTLESSITAIKSNVIENNTEESSFLPKHENESNLPNSSLLSDEMEYSKLNPTSKSGNKSNINDDENEIIDVEELTESTLTDESVVQEDSPQINKNEITSDRLKLDIKNAYVKLDRTSVVEKILMEKVDEIKNNNLQECQLDSDNNVNRRDVIENAKTAIVLVNDIIKNNENNIKLDSESGDTINLLTRKTDYVKINLITLNDDDDEVMEISIIEDRGENKLENSVTFDKRNNEKENLTPNSTIDNATEIPTTLEPVIDNNSKISLSNKTNDDPVKSSSSSINSDEIKDNDTIKFLEHKISDSESVNKSNCESENSISINVYNNETERTGENSNPINANDSETESTEAMQISENSNLINANDNETESTTVMLVSDNELTNSISINNENEESSKLKKRSDINDSDFSNTSSNNETINSIAITNNDDKIVVNSISVDQSSHDKSSTLLDEVDDITQIQSKNIISTSETDLLLESSITKNTNVNSDDKIEKSDYTTLNNCETSHSVFVDKASKDANGSTVNSINDNSTNEVFSSENVNELECYEIVNACHDNDKIKAKNCTNKSSNESTENSISLDQNNENKHFESIKESNNKVEDSVEQSTNEKQNLITLKETCDSSNACDNNVKKIVPNEVDNHQSKDSLSLSQPNDKINNFEHVNEKSDKTNSVLAEEDIETADFLTVYQANKELIKSNTVNNQNNDVNSMSSIDECSREMETSKAVMPEPMECDLNDGNDEIEMINIPDDTDSDSNETEPQISGMDKNNQFEPQLSGTDKNNETESQMSGTDKNGVSSAVTDADGESASSPEKGQRSNDASRKSASPKKSTRRESEQRRRSKADESDAEDVGDLFQDIPAEDWSHNKSQNKIAEKDEELNTTNEHSSALGASHDSSKNEKDIDGSDEASIEEAQTSFSKRTRKSSERKRESGQMAKSDTSESKDDAEVGESKETEESSNVDTEKDENASPNRSRRSTRKSLEANQSSSEKDKNKSMSEKLSTSLNDSKSSNKSRRSLDKSSRPDKSDQNNESLMDKLSTSLNSSKTVKKQSIINTSRNLATEEDEPMEVDEQSEDEVAITEVNNKSLNNSRKSLDKSQLNESSSKNESTPEKLSTSLNTSRTSKRLTLEKSMNTSSRKSLIEKPNEENVSSTSENRNAINKDEETENFNESSNALNDSKKSKRLSLNESSRKSLIKNEDEGNVSNAEMEVDSVNNKSLNKSLNKFLNTSNRKSLNDNEQIVSNANVSLKNKDNSLRESSLRKSISKSINMSNVIAEDSSETEAEGKENAKKNADKSMNNKSLLNASTKSSKSVKNTPVKSLVKDSDSEDDNIEPPELNDSQMDTSLQKSVQLMKFQNPPKHDYSTIAQADSGSDEEENENEEKIPQYLFQLSDSDGAKESNEEDGEEDEDEESDNNEDDSCQKSIDSDIAREYNLGGKDISHHSDDDVPADDCRASEEELSDSDDDGSDLDDFLVSDTGIDDDADESDENEEDEEAEEYEDDPENHEDDDVMDIEVKDDVKNKSGKKVKSLLETSVNNSKSRIKNRNVLVSQYSPSSGSETDNEDTETETENKPTKNNSANGSKLLKNKSINDSKTTKDKNINMSKSAKDNSINDSKSIKNKSVNISKRKNVDSDSDSNDETLQKKDKSANVSKISANKSINKSKSVKEVSMSKSIKDKSISDSKILKTNITNLSKMRITEASSSDESDDESSNLKSKQKPNIAIDAATSESESENGEDSYRIITAKPLNASLTQPKNKKLAPLIECSTPKPGMIKKTDFSKAGESFIETDNLSVTINKSLSQKRKSGSLTDLTNMKNVSSRLSVGEVATKSILKNSKANNSMKLKEEVDVIGTCEEAMKSRQLWKCVPLNKTVHSSPNETPVTKFLKKSKLNESVPVLKISDEAADEQESVKNTSKSEKRKSLQNKSVDKIMEQQVEQASVNKKSKKRKLEDVSLAASIDEDSMIKMITKNKKRARIEESTVEDAENEHYENTEDVQESKKKKKKKNKHVEVEDNVEEMAEFVVEDVRKIKKKKKNKSKELEVEEVPEIVEETQKKKKKNKQVNVEPEVPESPVTAEEKQKKKKKKSFDAEGKVQDDQAQVEVEKPKKKKNRLSDEISDLENVNVNVAKPAKKSKHSTGSNASEKKSKKKAKEELCLSVDADEEAPETVGFEEARRSALVAMQQAADSVKALKDVHKKKQQDKADRKLKRKDQEMAKPITGVKRLSEDIIDNLTEDPLIRRPEKRRKLTNKHIDRVMPSKTMFSPGKVVPVNLKVDDGYVPLSSTGGTTEFGVVNLIKAKKAAVKKSVAALTFREKMLARNLRQPMSAYLTYQKKLKAKTGL